MRQFLSSTVKRYCSSLNHIFNVESMDLSTSREFFMLTRSFEKSCSLWMIRPPAWVITLVLQNLMKVLYKPIYLASDRDQTLKTCIRLTLAFPVCEGNLQSLIQYLILKKVGIVYLLHSSLHYKDAEPVCLGCKVR